LEVSYSGFVPADAHSGPLLSLQDLGGPNQLVRGGRKPFCRINVECQIGVSCQGQDKASFKLQGVNSEGPHTSIPAYVAVLCLRPAGTCMDVADIAVRLRAVFETPPRAAITDAIALITVSVREQHREPPSPPITESLVALEKELLDIYEHSVDHNSVAHLEAFLSVLFVLRPVLPASSVISWFDHLRPALREPYLSAETKRNLQSLVASALNESAHAAESRSREFRRRLFQLFIVDASGTGASAEDIVEEANQSPSEKRMRCTWRENLESILELDLIASPDVRVTFL
jgi:hypothetical protein